MTEFMRPTVKTEEINDNLARFMVEPLERGYARTLGNSMRRVLLSSLEGARATSIKIEGVAHEFSCAEGVIEDVTDIVLNVKGLVFKQNSDAVKEATAKVSVDGPATVTGADLEVPSEFTLVNPEHVIATVAEGGNFIDGGGHALHNLAGGDSLDNGVVIVHKAVVIDVRGGF